MSAGAERGSLRRLRALWGVLTPREKRLLLGLLVTAIVTAALEALGVGSILPFVTIISDPGGADTNRFLARLRSFLGNPSSGDFVTMLGAGAFVMVVLTNAMGALTSYGIMRYSAMREAALSTRLLDRYLRQPYEYFLSQNSSTLSRNVLTEVSLAVSSFLMPALESTARAVSALCVFVLLLLVDIVAALLAVGVIGGAYVLVYVWIRRGLYRSGAGRLESSQARFKSVAEALGGIKELKLLGAEGFFVGTFGAAARRYGRSEARTRILTHLPRHLLEAVAFGGVVVGMMLLSLRDGGASQSLPLMGLFVFAAYRVMPSLQTVFRGFGLMRYHGQPVDLIVADLRRPVSPEPAPRKTPLHAPHESVEARSIRFQYPGRPTPVLAGLTLRMEVPSVVGLVGPTGCGKTTLVDVLVGLLRPSEGEILVDGAPLSDADMTPWRRMVGYVPQSVFLADDSISANIAFGSEVGHVDVARVVAAARAAQLDAFVNRELPQGYATRVGDRGVQLSGGQRQRVGIARALYRGARILVLDEATSALDGATEASVLQAVADSQPRPTVLIVAHRATTLRRCDVIHVMSQGRFAASGSFSELERGHEGFRAVIRPGD